MEVLVGEPFGFHYLNTSSGGEGGGRDWPGRGGRMAREVIQPYTT